MKTTIFHNFSNTCWYMTFLLALLVGGKWHLIVVIVCIFLITDDVAHHFRSFCPLFFFIFGEMYIQILCQLKNRLFIFILLSLRVLHIFSNPLPYIRCANVFSHSVAHLFLFLMVCFAACKFYSVQFIYFFFMPCALVSHLRNHCLTQGHIELVV